MGSPHRPLGHHATQSDRKASETTIRTFLKHLRAALSWAVEVGMLRELPKVTYQNRTRKSLAMKGRPITAEEFDRMIELVPAVRPQDAVAWTRLLHGLWLSGLRLGESLRLSWDADEPFCVDLRGRHPHFRILAEGQKAKRDELLPMTPDFADWLLRTPEGEREGPVFPVEVNRDAATRIISKIGQKAGVVVDKASDKFATAHDLRRSFGTRWSNRVKPATLQKLMRHADIKTTMDFYVRHDADDIAADLWSQHAGNISGNTQVGVTVADLNPGHQPATCTPRRSSPPGRGICRNWRRSPTRWPKSRHTRR